MKVYTTPEAAADIAELAEKLELARSGVGLTFLKQYRNSVESIERFPRLFAETEDGVPGLETRNAILERFEVRVIYLVRDEDAVVIAVQHGRLRPASWHPRLKTNP